MKPLRADAIDNIIIWKQFEGVWHKGVVKAYDAEAKHYYVQYEDGDAEEFNWKGLLGLSKEPPAGACKWSPAAAPTYSADGMQQQQQYAQQQQHTQKSAKPAEASRSFAPDVLGSQHRPGTEAPAAPAALQAEGTVQGSPDCETRDKGLAGDSGGSMSCSGSTASEAARIAAALLVQPAQAEPAAAAAAGGGALAGRIRSMARKTCAGLLPKATFSTATAGDNKCKPRKLQQQQQEGSAAAAGAPARKRQRTSNTGSSKTNKQEHHPVAADVNAAAAPDQQRPKKQQQRQYKRKTPSDAAEGLASSARASSSTAAAAAVTAEDVMLEAGRQLSATVSFQPAACLHTAYMQAVCGGLQPENSDEAAAVVLEPKCKQPLWKVEDKHVKVHKGDALKYLEQHAVDFEPGAEPYRRFLGLPRTLASRIRSVRHGAGAAAAAVGAAAGAAPAAGSGSSGQLLNQQQQQTATSQAAGAVVDQAAGAVAAVLLEGKVFHVAEQPFADPDAQLAQAIKIARDEFWREFRLATVTEAERVAARKAAQAAAVESSDMQQGQRKKVKTSSSKSNQANEHGPQAIPSSTEPESNAVDLSKNPSARPDRVAESAILQSKRAVNRFGSQRDTWGHLPGISINDKFMLRSEAQVLGVHKSPMTGIVSADIPVPLVVGGETYRGVKAATSIVMSGCYQDDRDATSHIIKYTGEGGNDLLGNKKQQHDQKLERGNRALLANIALGLPVRVLRRNDDQDSATNSMLWYDGLYNVVSWVKTIGEEGKVVFLYGLKRRQSQDASKSKPIERFKSVKTANKKTDGLVRQHIICKDLSKGKEATPIVVVNEVDRELPPGIDPEADATWIVDDRKETSPLQKSKEQFRYITEDEYDAGVLPPQPPQVAEEGSNTAAEAIAAELNAAADAAASSDPLPQQQQQHEGCHVSSGGAGCSSSSSLRSRSNDAAAAEAVSADAVAAGAVAVTPSGTGGRPNGCLCWYSKELVLKRPGETPHDLLKRMNWGYLPYESRVRSSGKESGPRLPVSRGTCPVLTECGDWTGCTDPNCDQRQGMRGVQYRLELFKTRDRGWGVRSWDTIKCGTLVCIMWGRVAKNGALEWESSYLFDKTPRTWGSIIDASGPLTEAGKALLKDEKPWEAKYVLCAKEQGGIARFINHSCEPTLYVQPMCISHTDTDMVAVGLFAGANIPTFTELTYDYGNSYVEHNLGGICLCGATCCKYKPKEQQQQHHTSAAAATAMDDD